MTNAYRLAALAIACFSIPALAGPPDVQISELRVDQPGADNDEYFELFGQPEEFLDGLTYIVLGDGAGGSGVIECIVELDGQTLGLDGLFVAATPWETPICCSRQAGSLLSPTRLTLRTATMSLTCWCSGSLEQWTTIWTPTMTACLMSCPGPK